MNNIRLLTHHLKIKNMKSTIKKMLFLVLITTLLSSCSVDMFNGINDDRNVVTKNRTTNADFSKIKVNTGLELEISQGNENKIVLEADENLHDIIFTEVENGVLKIYSEKSIWKAKSKKVFVTVKNLHELSATSGVFVNNETIFKADTLTVIATSGAEINFSVEANSIITVATSGADLKIAGKANYHNSNATSGASIRAKSLESATVFANVTSGADIDIFASETFNANATSGGDINYFGNPKKATKKTTSGGSISEN